MFERRIIMNKNDKVTCSFVMDRATYNAYKSVIAKSGESVKASLVKFMKNAIQYETPNAETIEAIKEVEAMKKDPSIGTTYKSVDEMIGDILDV